MLSISHWQVKKAAPLEVLPFAFGRHNLFIQQFKGLLLTNGIFIVAALMTPP